MQLVAAAKMKKAQDQATTGRAYAELLNKVLVSLQDGAEEGVPSLLRPKARASKTLVLVITTDKGLCGALNTNLLKKLVAADARRRRATSSPSAARPRRRSAACASNLIADFPVKDPAKFAELRAGRQLRPGAVPRRRTTSKVLVAFNNFVNTVTIIPTVEQLLPVNPVTLGGKRSLRGHGRGAGGRRRLRTDVPQYTFEPERRGRLRDHPAAVRQQHALPDAAGSPRLRALQPDGRHEERHRQREADASRISRLEYNKLRQAAITNELLEITTAKMALE